MRRLVLVRHATTSAVRAAAFPADEPLDAAGLAACAAVAADGPDGRGPAAGRGLLRGDAFASPARRARQTAEALGLTAAVVDPALAECDFGTWAGLPLADCHERDPDAVGAWFADPDAAPHGGESLRAFAVRVGAWLDAQATLDGRAACVTHGGVVKAAVVHALGAPLDAFWRLDAAPLHATELHCHDGTWTVRALNVPLAPSGGGRPATATPPGGERPSCLTPRGTADVRSGEAVA